jgi:mono/diheme cytochrome c family protein
MIGSARVIVWGAVPLVVAVGAFWILTMPETVTASALPAYTPNLDNGMTMFNAGGCASCHAIPNKDPDKVDRTRLGGGLALNSPFGTFYAPNISPDPNDGIGKWNEANFIAALWKGAAPDGSNLYPAFPYTSYHLMALADTRDLFAYLKTLPPVPGKIRGHDLSFPFNVRRLLGGWKLLFLQSGTYVPDASKSAQWNRGAYLVNGPGHCAECHSPRNALGAIIGSERFAGGPSPDGNGWVPNITPFGLGKSVLGNVVWTEKDIASFLGDGMNPVGDVAGGAMTEVIRNTSLLSPEDRGAMANYIASLPPIQGPTPPPKK